MKIKSLGSINVDISEYENISSKLLDTEFDTQYDDEDERDLGEINLESTINKSDSHINESLEENEQELLEDLTIFSSCTKLSRIKKL